MARAPQHPDSEVLISWFADQGRDLPWRLRGTPAWHILISEVMLQQTPVARVLPIWLDWTRRWPTPSAMAAASPAEVLRAWGKLGYPRRALRLHECARVLAEQHGDEVPADVDTLLGLPGVGAYTARAIACFAYGQRVPVVDINVRRVIARTVHGQGDPGPASTTRDLADVAAALPVGQRRAAQYSAALMELGALVCTARKPGCDRCPLPECAWRAAGFPTYDGPKRPTQRFEGTDRQARGRLLDVLRDAPGPVDRTLLDLAWTVDPGQRDRALDSLLVDGLIEQTDTGLFALPGELSPG
ncbi:A/G-specific adenine glycosylase [Tomitella biformata]|uniref:A/G-specific adenine glycosylase n=1 Tax=Tomitella biformata TaxID=630403 RepID=UPI0004AF418B|nr:A/G-specific adenine glycosylase [Tomitella biformata]